MQFNYQARNKDGEFQKGVIEAQDEASALESLRNRELIVFYLAPLKREFFLFRKIPFIGGVKKRDIVIFSRQLAVLFRAKVPLISAMKTLVRQAGNPFLKETLTNITKDVEGGMALSRAISKHPKVFDNFYLNMVKTGEYSGSLDETFEYLANHLEREYEFESKVRGAMIYPAFVLVVFLVIMILMLTFVIPHLTTILKEANADIPFTTKIIMGISDAFINFWWVFLIIFLGAIGAFVYYQDTKEGRLYIDWVKIKIPIFGSLFQKIYLARFSESLGTLIVGGLPITQAIEVTSEVIGNVVYKDIMTMAAEEVKKGSMISGVLKSREEIPAFVSEMVAVGEESGRLDYVLENISKFYQKEVATVLDNITTLIEPVLIVFLGIGVAILVAAVILPIYNAVQTYGLIHILFS